jgi:hypothetical protein
MTLAFSLFLWSFFKEEEEPLPLLRRVLIVGCVDLGYFLGVVVDWGEVKIRVTDLFTGAWRQLFPLSSSSSSSEEVEGGEEQEGGEGDVIDDEIENSIGIPPLSSEEEEDDDDNDGDNDAELLEEGGGGGGNTSTIKPPPSMSQRVARLYEMTKLPSLSSSSPPPPKIERSYSNPEHII